MDLTSLRTPRRPRSSLFVIASSDAGPDPGPFPAATRVRADAGAKSPSAVGVDVWAGQPERVRTMSDPASDCAVYVWGRPVTPCGCDGAAGLIRLATHDGGRGLREVIGQYVLVIDDRRQRRVTFVSDVLGLRPWFVGRHAGRLVAGSDVLALCEAGLSERKADPDAIASWLYYNFDCTGGSVLLDYKRLPPGSVCTYDYRGQLLLRTEYAPLCYERRLIPQDQLVDGLHERVSHAFDRIACGLGEATLPLSGGYDSRYLCCLASRRDNGRWVRLINLRNKPAETVVAGRVAAALGMPLQTIPAPAQVLDLYDDPFPPGGDGFPCGRNLTSAIARFAPDRPVLSGYLGDGLMRSWRDQGMRDYFAQDDQPLEESAYVAAVHRRYQFPTNRLGLLKKGLSQRASARALEGVRPLVRVGLTRGAPLMFSNIHLRHRLYFAHVFLAHLDEAEGLLPFYSWALLDYHARHRGSFQPDNYLKLYARHFPAVADIPRDSDLEASADAPPKRPPVASRHLRPWAANLVRHLLSRRFRDTALVPRRILKRLPGGLLADRRVQDEIFFLHKVALFEERLRKAGVQLEWSTV